MKDVSVVPRRRRLCLVLAALAFALALLIGFWRSVGTPPSAPATSAVPQAVDWGTAEAQADQFLPSAPRPIAPTLPALQLGAYITNVNDIDLLNDQFSIELLLWTIWQGDPEQNPSDQLRILNGIYNGDTQRFERLRRDQINGSSWSLYAVRSPVVKRWQLQRYPFDDQLLHVQIGLEDPLQPVNLDVVPADPSTVSPGLLLPGWILKSPTGYVSSISLMSDLGRPMDEAGSVRRQPTVSFDLPIQRRSLLFVAPDFLGYMLAVGLCCMSLLITRSRDDLILAAVVSAGGNFVFIAGKLPVTAMAGFIGNLQLIVFLGILYVVAADELIDVHLLKVNNRLSTVLRVLLLPSYVAMTLIGVYWIIP